MKIYSIPQAQTFTSLKISSSVLDLKPKNRAKIDVVRDVASSRPDIDFTIESDIHGDLQVTVQRANPLDLLLACGIVKFKTNDFYMIEAMKAAQRTYNDIYEIKQKDYKETIPEEADAEETAFILEDMADILLEEIDPPEVS